MKQETIMRIVFATKNAHKMEEIHMILKGLPYDVISMEEAGIDIDVVEDGTTFEENAMKKATEIMEVCGDIVLADDSGLEIDYLGKEPGIYSARYLGRDTPYPEKNQIIIDKLAGVEGDERSARFVCVIAAAFPDGRRLSVRGTIEGVIAHEIMGANGFGYDPIFFVPEVGTTTAMMAPEDKNAISHRGNALRGMHDLLKKELK